MATSDQATRNQKVAGRWVEEVLNHRNASAVDELMAPDCEEYPVWYNPVIPSTISGGSTIDRLLQNVDRDFMGLTNPHTTIDQTIAAGDKVVGVTTTNGTRNGKHVSYRMIVIYRFADEKIAEMWYQWDRLGVYQQLGVLPETPELMRQAGLEW